MSGLLKISSLQRREAAGETMATSAGGHANRGKGQISWLVTKEGVLGCYGCNYRQVPKKRTGESRREENRTEKSRVGSQLVLVLSP